MPNVGTISGSMVLDPSAYIEGLNTAAGATRAFQQGVSSISFAGFNRGIFATTTLLYGLERVISNMSRGMEDYANLLGRIGTVADMTASSVSALADSMKSVSVHYGVSRKDIMGGMYTSAQAGYGTPAEMRAMAVSGAKLTRASGKEIDVKQSVDLMTGLRQSLGIGAGALSSNRMTDILLKARDIGRWELNQMVEPLAKASTVWGNQFSGTLGGEETLRQLLSVMSVASLTGLPLGMVATGTRRLAEKTMQLSHTKRGDRLAAALRGIGYRSENPIMEAWNRGGMSYLSDLGTLSNGSPDILEGFGYQARELTGITTMLRNRGQNLRSAYQDLGYGNVSGVTEKYGEKMRSTYDYSRERLRAQWEITSQQFMQASIPLINQFTGALETFNKVAQALPESVKSFMMLLSAMAGLRLAMNFLGFRRNTVLPNLGKELAGGGRSFASLGASAGMSVTEAAVDFQAARQARRMAAAAGRGSSYTAGFGQPSRKWVSNEGAPWGTSFVPFKPMMWNEIPLLSRTSGGGFGPRWYNAPRGEPMNYYQYHNMLATSAKFDELRRTNNRKFWAPNGMPWIRPTSGGPTLTMAQEELYTNTAALGRKYLPISSQTGMPLSGRELTPGYRSSPYGPTIEQRIKWEAYKRGQQVDFSSGSYGSLSPAWQGYFAGRGTGQASLSVREARDMSAYGRSRAGTSGAMIGNIRGQIAGNFGTPSFANQLGRYSAASQTFATRGVPTNTGMYAAMGIGGTAQVIGTVTQGLSTFGMAVMRVVGPLAILAAVVSIVSGLLKGARYNEDPAEKEGGLLKMRSEGLGYNPLSMLAPTVGAALFNRRNFGNLMESYAREYGVTADADGKGWSKFRSFWRTGTTAFAGYRDTTENDVMARVARENLSPAEVAKYGRGGVNFSDFSSVKGKLNKYMKEQLGMQAPNDWGAWVRNTKGGAGKLAEYITDALKFAGDEIAKAATAAAKSIRKITEPFIPNMKPFLAYNLGYETMFSLEGSQKGPFASRMNKEWLEKYKTAYGEFRNSYAVPTFSDSEIERTLKQIREVTNLDEGEKKDDKFTDTVEASKDWGRRISMMSALMKYGPELGDKQKISDARIVRMFGLADKEMGPEQTQSVVDKIRGLDYTSFVQSFSPQKVPFSNALMYGTREGYNATLERKDDFVLRAIPEKLKSLVDSIVAREDKVNEGQKLFEGNLKGYIEKASSDIVNAINGNDGRSGYPGVDGGYGEP